jgi:hypothetical protein
MKKTMKCHHNWIHLSDESVNSENVSSMTQGSSVQMPSTRSEESLLDIAFVFFPETQKRAFFFNIILMPTLSKT